MTYSCHDGFCGAEDCETCRPGCNDPAECPACGQTVKPSKMLTCKSCGGNYCHDCLSDDLICEECEKDGKND